MKKSPLKKYDKEEKAHYRREEKEYKRHEKAERKDIVDALKKKREMKKKKQVNGLRKASRLNRIILQHQHQQVQILLKRD